MLGGIGGGARIGGNAVEMRALVVFTVMALGAACASPEPAKSTAESSVGAVATASARGANAAWRYALPPRWDISQVRVGDAAVVLGGRSGIRVLDRASGRLRWQRAADASVLALGDTAVFYGATGTIVSRALSSGRVLWERRSVCPSATDSTAAGGVAMIARDAHNIVVGCRGGRLVRIAAVSGRIMAHSDTAFIAESIGEIAPLGACAYGVSGWSSGAALRSHAAIVDCKRLSVIVPEQDGMAILGAIENIAILDERCCFGRPDVYRPATIVRANLATGALSPEVDLTPEPDRYAPDHRPIGQGSAALLDGSALYLAVDRSLYGYGDPRALRSAPQRIAADLVDFPVVLRHGMLAVRLRVPDGAIDDEIVRIRNGTLEALWSSRESAPGMFGYEPALAPDVLSVRKTDGSNGQTLVRIYDGTQLFVTDPCQLYGASRDLLVMLCTTDVLAGNRYLQYVAAYRWPAAIPR